MVNVIIIKCAFAVITFIIIYRNQFSISSCVKVPAAPFAAALLFLSYVFARSRLFFFHAATAFLVLLGLFNLALVHLSLRFSLSIGFCISILYLIFCLASIFSLLFT